MLVSVCVVDEDVFVVWVPPLEASCWAGREVATVMVSGEEEGEEGLRRAVKFTADGEGCIRASEKGRLLFPQDDRLSWGDESSAGRVAADGWAGVTKDPGSERGRLKWKLDLVPSAGGLAKRGDEWCGLVMVWSEKFGGREREEKESGR
jgi:hypothetical protein